MSELIWHGFLDEAEHRDRRMGPMRGRALGNTDPAAGATPG